MSWTGEFRTLLGNHYLDPDSPNGMCICHRHVDKDVSWEDHVILEMMRDNLVPVEHQLSEDEHWNGDPGLERWVTEWRRR
jgi:hypothetical protein